MHRREQRSLQQQQALRRPTAVRGGQGEQARRGDRDDERREREELDQHAVRGCASSLPMRTKLPVTCAVNSPNSATKADRVDVAGDEAQRAAR
jgi:hypothetical protein